MNVELQDEFDEWMRTIGNAEAVANHRPFREWFVPRIERIIEREARALVEGKATDYADYRSRCGVIAGLRRAVDYPDAAQIEARDRVQEIRTIHDV